MDLVDLIIKRRTIRRFEQEKIPADVMEKIIDAGRLAPSASNLQPWEFIVVDEQGLCEKVFSCTSWAGCLGGWSPKESERPVAYIVILANKNVRATEYEHDVGIAAAQITLAALGNGIGSCIIRSLNREKIKNILNIPENYIIELGVALGYPAESPVLEDGKRDNEGNFVKYWRDEKEVSHVPKRPREKIIHRNGF